MENKQDQKQFASTPTPSIIANVGIVGTGISQGNLNGARAGQKSVDSEQDSYLDRAENHMSKADLT